MSGAHNFVEDLALIFSIATVAMLIFARLRQSPVLGYLLAGLVVGPHSPIPPRVEVSNVELISQLGVVLVIFSIGLEFDLRKLGRQLPTAGVAGAIAIGSMLSMGFAAAKIAGWPDTESLFFGAALAVSSTMIASRAVRGVDDRRVVDNVLGLLIIQDLAAVVLIALLTAVASGKGLPPRAVFATLGELLVFYAGALVAGLFVVPRAIRAAGRLGGSEGLLIASIGICFGLALLAERLGYSAALGAFVAGTLVAESGRRRQVERVVSPVRDLFAAVFFVSIGMLVDLGALWRNAALVAAVSVLVLVGQSLAVTFGSLVAGKGVRVALRSGMALAQIGELSFIMVGIGVSAGVVAPRILAVTVGVALITTFLTPLAVASSATLARKVERRLPRRLQTLESLYGAWIESLRPTQAERRGPLRHHLIYLGVDVAVIAGAVIATALWRDALGAVIARYLGLTETAATGLAAAALVAAALPFVVGLARTTRRIAVLLAVRAVPRRGGGLDLGAAPRGALVLAVEIAVILAVLMPLFAVSLPFLNLWVAAAIIGATLAALGLAVWRSAANLQGHVRAGAELLLEALDRQRAGGDEELPELPELLPGLGALTRIEVAPGSPAAGHTLGDLDLFGLTGATVIAINRAGGDSVAVPGGDATLAAGDLVAVTGSHTAIEEARRIIAGPPRSSKRSD